MTILDSELTRLRIAHGRKLRGFCIVDSHDPSIRYSSLWDGSHYDVTVQKQRPSGGFGSVFWVERLDEVMAQEPCTLTGLICVRFGKDRFSLAGELSPEQWIFIAEDLPLVFSNVLNKRIRHASYIRMREDGEYEQDYKLG